MINESVIRILYFLRLLLVLCVAVPSTGSVADSTGGQTADDRWSPTVTNPEFPRSDGPTILVDAAHGNFHTIDGRFSAFAKLLNLDGYRTESAVGEVTQGLLDPVRVFVISNAIYGGADAEWILPTYSAFKSEEVEVIVNWVESGGSLLLIADHMPFPGATRTIATEFGIDFINGYAKKSVRESGELSFSRSNGSLTDHPITRGRSDSESVKTITSFTGQAFRIAEGVEPLMHMPDDWKVFLPTEADLIGKSTPFVSARGLVQGAVLKFGSGRVAVFGEAAMFTAQTWERDDGSIGRMGMNHPTAVDNAQFVLNVVHWLMGEIDD